MQCSCQPAGIGKAGEQIRLRNFSHPGGGALAFVSVCAKNNPLFLHTDLIHLTALKTHVINTAVNKTVEVVITKPDVSPIMLKWQGKFSKYN